MDALGGGGRGRRLAGWLVAATDAAEHRLRDGFPPGWRVGNKPGTWVPGATNDVAVAWPPDRGPIVVSAYLAGAPTPVRDQEAVLAEVARILHRGGGGVEVGDCALELAAPLAEAAPIAIAAALELDDGDWQGRRILPAGWAREATARHVANVAANPNSPGYGYQWWRYDRRGAEVWAGNGFGGQFLVVLPAQRVVGFFNSWNVFGQQVSGVLGPFIDALLNAAGVPAPAPGGG